MSRLTDPTFLKEQQYKTPTNFSARIALHEYYTIAAQPWLEWVMDRILAAAQSDARTLEVGCGRGDLWEQNAHRVPRGWEITLADFSGGMAREARGRLHNAGMVAQGFEVVNIERLPFASHSFDLVIANHMLYHVPNRARALSEVRRVLKTGGGFFAATNGEAHLRELFDVAERVLPNLKEYRDSLRSGFSLENGAARLERVFDHVDVTRYPSELRVDAVQPLVDFILSMSPALDADQSVTARLHEAYAAEIARGGGMMHIGKDAGMFTAW
jgi:ubiquinone/menaquinone biosynthesis C-methylase UbiE